MKPMLLGCLLCMFAAAASAENFSGKWAIASPGRYGGTQKTILVLNQVGGDLEGSLTPGATGGDGSPINVEILDGKVQGETITFYVWSGRDRPQKTFYEGKMSGDQIAFTVTGGPAGPAGGAPPGGAQTGPRQVVAKRTK